MPRNVVAVMSRRWNARARLFALITTALAVLVTLMLADRASAHAQLVRTVPEASAELTTSPPFVEIDFAEGVRAVPGGIRVLGQDGKRVDDARPTSKGNSVRLVLPKLTAGAYVVSWRVVSEDGHPVRGAYTFRVGGSGSQAAAAKLAEKLLVSGVSRTDTAAVAAALRTIVFAAMALLLGAAAHVLVVDRRPVASLRRVLLSTALIGVGCSILSLIVYGPLVTGQSLAAISDGTLLDDSLGDHVGQAMAARAILLGLLAALVLSRVRRTPERVLAADGPIVVVAIALGIAQAFTGHGGSGKHLAVALPSTVIHVLAMGVWAGGLVMLLLTLRGQRSVTDRLAVTQRFSRLAGVAVGALVASGSVALWRQVRTIDALQATSSGRLLLVKLALVGALLLLGAKNRRALGDTTHPERAVGAVRRTISVEIIGMALVLAVTALIVNLPPARDVVSRPIAVTATTSTGLVDITVEPARVGRNELHIYALTKQGASRPVESIEATLTNAAAGVEGLESQVVRAGANHFQALGLDLPVKGTWRIDIIVKLDAFTEETGSATFTLR
jgi:copper transport protein